MQKYAKVCKSMQKYAKVCKSMQKYAKVCKSMQKYAKVCKSMQTHCIAEQLLLKKFFDLEHGLDCDEMTVFCDQMNEYLNLLIKFL